MIPTPTEAKIAYLPQAMDGREVNVRDEVITSARHKVIIAFPDYSHEEKVSFFTMLTS